MKGAIQGSLEGTVSEHQNRGVILPYPPQFWRGSGRLHSRPAMQHSTHRLAHMSTHTRPYLQDCLHAFLQVLCWCPHFPDRLSATALLPDGHSADISTTFLSRGSGPTELAASLLLACKHALKTLDVMGHGLSSRRFSKGNCQQSMTLHQGLLFFCRRGPLATGLLKGSSVGAATVLSDTPCPSHDMLTEHARYAGVLDTQPAHPSALSSRLQQKSFSIKP